MQTTAKKGLGILFILGAALCFNDADEGKVRRYMTFGGGIADRKCPALFRKAVLAE